MTGEADVVVEVDLDCGGGRHRLSARRGAPGGSEPVAADHADVDAELALHALGSPLPPCLAVVRAWRTLDLSVLPDDARLDVLPLLVDRLADNVSLLPTASRAPLDAAVQTVVRPIVHGQLAEVDGVDRGLQVQETISVGGAKGWRTGGSQIDAYGTLRGGICVLNLIVTVGWLRDVWAAGLADIGGDLVLRAQRLSPTQVTVRVARWIEQPGILDGRGDRMPLARQWAYVPVATTVEM